MCRERWAACVGPPRDVSPPNLAVPRGAAFLFARYYTINVVSFRGITMPDALPVPTLDHVVINLRDRIDAGAETFRRLGLTLTPRGYHTLGSMNHVAVFGTEYLELIAAPASAARRPEILTSPEGLNGLVFSTDDADRTCAALRAAGVPVDPPQQFSRAVELPGSARDATFRTVSLRDGTVHAGRIYFCHHLTRELVWRDEWRHHANGVIGVSRAVIAAQNPASVGAVFARMFGHDAVRDTADGCSLAVGLSRFDVITPDALKSEYGDAAPDGGGRSQFMASLGLRTRSLRSVEAALAAGGVSGVQHSAGRIVVPASSAFGVTMEFRE